ncbi:hypothetical protein NHF46_04045 [Arthrobacter alpinus]|nr:hypothetical protein [Arthrobacter alpinus]
MSKSLFVSWISFHGRSDGIADALGMTKVNISTASRFKPFGYVRAFLETRGAIKETRPETVIVMAPPFFAILSVILLNYPKKYRIFADLHTGVFYDPKWKFALAPTLRLLRNHAAIVTNSHLATICQDAGIETHILHDFIDDKTEETTRATQAMESVFENLNSFEYALVPLAYEHDEPLLQLLDAASQDPEITWVLTGRAPEEYMMRAPSNVFFPGFVDNETFESLLTNAGCVCALTTKGETMQRAAYEGLSYGKSIVVSSQNVLTEYYGDSVSYTDNSAQGIYESGQPPWRTD